MKKLFFFIIILFGSNVWSQLQKKDTVTRRAEIIPIQNNNTFNFKADTPLLNQIAGAPKAFYTYFWEFGDGNYSTKATPKHTYKVPGNYEVKLWATNNYDTGKTPTTRPKKVNTADKAEVSDNEIQTLDDNIVLKRNREPSPDQEFVVLMSYKNTKDYVTNGTLYFYYNENEFKNDNFNILETKIYHGETIEEENLGLAYQNKKFINDDYNFADENYLFQQKIIDSTEKKDLKLSLQDAKKTFKNKKVIKFNNLNPNEQRNIFFTLKTTPEMIKDTSAIIRVRSIYVPDNNQENHKIKDMEMEVVTSHDPNKMSNNGFLINYRLVRFKRVKFKTQFQNNGEGPARKIRLETDVPDMFDKKTFKIEKMYPDCPICPKHEVEYSCLDTIFTPNQIIFTFKNIYLPGSEQKNVTEKDSTKGFVKYSLKFGKDFHKVKTKSRTAIIFDKNEPIITNYSVTRFNPGISIGARVGYNYFPKLNNTKSFFAGATISPFKSYRWYWQSEMYATYHDFADVLKSNVNINNLGVPITLANGQIIDRAFTQAEQESKTVRKMAEVVPVSIRYNINNYVGVGFGPQITTVFSPETTLTTVKSFYFIKFLGTNTPTQGDEITQLKKTETITTKASTEVQTSLFLDVTLGFARIGPSLGFRYLNNFKENFNALQFYAIWKF